MQKKILTTEHSLASPINLKEIQTKQSNKDKNLQIASKDIYLSISKYSETIMIVINQTQTMGSIYKAKFIGHTLPQISEDDLEQEDNQQNQPEFLYQIKCLFGSTDLEFYELLIRKLIQVAFQQKKIASNTSIIVNISLPVKWKRWEEFQSEYYKQILNRFSQRIKEVC